MKDITGRHNIALAINTSGKPVVAIDLDNKEYIGYDEDAWSAKGSKIRIEREFSSPRYAGEKYYDHAVLFDYGGEHKDGHVYTLLTWGFGIYADFGYDDVIEDVEWANTPIVHEGDHIIVVELHSKTREYMVREGVVTLNGANITPGGYID